MDQQFIMSSDASLPLLTSDCANQIICRTCLSEQCSTQSLFEADIDKMLMYCTSIQIYQGDGLPSQICTNCVIHVTQAYNFKQQVEGSDATLRQCLHIYKSEGQAESNSTNNANIDLLTSNIKLTTGDAVEDVGLDKKCDDISLEDNVEDEVQEDKNGNDEKKNKQKLYRCCDCFKEFLSKHS